MITVTKKDITLESFQFYVKNPVVVRAMKMDDDFKVETLEGTMTGKKGDYLIIGVAGEMYPCRDDIFKKTYSWIKRQ